MMKDYGSEFGSFSERAARLAKEFDGYRNIYNSLIKSKPEIGVVSLHGYNGGMALLFAEKIHNVAEVTAFLEQMRARVYALAGKDFPGNTESVGAVNTIAGEVSREFREIASRMDGTDARELKDELNKNAERLEQAYAGWPFPSLKMLSSSRGEMSIVSTKPYAEFAKASLEFADYFRACAGEFEKYIRREDVAPVVAFDSSYFHWQSRMKRVCVLTGMAWAFVCDFAQRNLDVPGFIDVRRYSLERLSSDVREVEAWGKEVRMASAKADNFINPAYADELDAQIARWRKVLDTALAVDGLTLPVSALN
ncbi:MAG: hypothetical protein ACLGSA_00575 [Acidobacteriota bacterium]